MKKFILPFVIACASAGIHARTLIVYYSFTNNVHTIATELSRQTGGDLLRIEPAEEGLDYAANGYAIGSALIAAIRNNPGDAASYPDIKPVETDLAAYSTIIVAAPLWWGNMAAPLQTYLFHHGAEMAGKKIGLVVSSASSGISGVESDAHRLIPDGDFLTPSLWIRSSETARCRPLVADWLSAIDYSAVTGIAAAQTPDDGATVHVQQGMLFIDGTFDYCRLYSLAGTKLMESSSPAMVTSSLTPGAYVVTVTNGEHTAAQTILMR